MEDRTERKTTHISLIMPPHKNSLSLSLSLCHHHHQKQMITHSPAIAVTLAVDMTALLLYNVAGMAVTGHLGAVFRTVLETGRTLFVWVVDLILFYGGVGGGKLGESWSGWSWMQLGGFAVLVAGTLVYGRGDEAEGAGALLGACGRGLRHGRAGAGGGGGGGGEGEGGVGRPCTERERERE